MSTGVSRICFTNVTGAKKVEDPYFCTVKLRMDEQLLIDDDNRLEYWT